MKTNWLKIGLLAAASACTLLPIAASAKIFLSAPAPDNGSSYPGAPTELYSINEDGTDLTYLGEVTVNGTDVAVSAIALNSSGTLYGFIYDNSQGSQLIWINLTTLEGTPVGTGAFISEQVVGAAFDRFDRLWVTDRNNTMQEFNIAELSYDGVPIPLPNSSDIGGDLAFDLDGNCYYMGTLPENTSTNLYSCDIDAGTFTDLGEWTTSGFADGGGNISVSGLAVSILNTTCGTGMIVADGLGIDEIGSFDPDTNLITQVSNTGINVSYFNHLDLAGFASVAQVPECNFCGNGTVDDGEECDDGNTDSGDGCSEVCLFEYPPECGNGTLDTNEECDDGNNLPDDGCSPSCMLVDADGDGVADDDDLCPATKINAKVDQDGCSGEQLVDLACPCPDNDATWRWRNHGRYVSCIAREARTLFRAGLLTKKQKARLVSRKAIRGCGIKKRIRSIIREHQSELPE